MTEPNRKRGLIRMALMGTAFVGLTAVLIVFQPGSPRHALQVAEPEASVTRVAPAGLETVTAAPAPAATDQTASMRDLTNTAISNLRTATGTTTAAAPAPGQPGSLLYSVVQRSMGGTAQPGLPSPEVTRTAAAPAATYLVEPGDTLVGIARKLYGDVNMASEIFLLNTAVMPRPDSLRAGMVLALPVR